jgi:hypothetical protein
VPHLPPRRTFGRVDRDDCDLVATSHQLRDGVAEQSLRSSDVRREILDDVEDSHRRDSPRMLRKKLEKMI